MFINFLIFLTSFLNNWLMDIDLIILNIELRHVRKQLQLILWLIWLILNIKVCLPGPVPPNLMQHMRKLHQNCTQKHSLHYTTLEKCEEKISWKCILHPLLHVQCLKWNYTSWPTYLEWLLAQIGDISGRTSYALLENNWVIPHQLKEIFGCCLRFFFFPSKPLKYIYLRTLNPFWGNF